MVANGSSFADKHGYSSDKIFAIFVAIGNGKPYTDKKEPLSQIQTYQQMKTINRLFFLPAACLWMASLPLSQSTATTPITKKSTTAKVASKVQTQAAKTTGTTSSTKTTSTTVSNATAASGLKEALAVGVSNAVLSLNKENGYFGNEALKILLPKEAAPMVNNIKMVPGGQSMLNDVIVRLNRAAEDAAGDAKPIFINAITNMSIADATTILFGSSKTGATDYLKQNTYTQLTTAYRPKVENSLNKNLVGNMSTTESWTRLTKAYNKVAHSFVGTTAGLTAVNTDLSGYVTEQALNGMFLTVGNEEKKIRENPTARVSSVLQSVFSVLDKK